MGNHRSLLPPLRFLIALLVCRALPHRDLVEGAPFRLHPHMGVAGKHGARDVPGDAHNHLIARARFGEFGD